MYLRLSVTDGCGFRCPYCQPDAPGSVTPGASLLTPPEIRRVVSVLADLGTSRVRLTGGEPLGRRDLTEIVAAIANVPGIREVAITTNGQSLAGRSNALKRAGLSRVNVHIDSLRADRYRALTGHGSLTRALDGVEAALVEGLRPVKINTVLMRGINDDEVNEFCRLATTWGVTVRFIELMNTGPAPDFVRRHFMRASEARAVLMRNHVLTPRFEHRGASPAREYNVDAGAGTVGFIASESEPFCAACNRLRISGDGRLRGCLYETRGLDLAALVRDPSISDAQLREGIAIALNHKQSYHPPPGGIGDTPFAMAQIGG